VCCRLKDTTPPMRHFLTAVDQLQSLDYED
jgi:hypothetical protein